MQDEAIERFLFLGQLCATAKPKPPPPVQPPRGPLCEVAEFCAFDCETTGLTGFDVAVQVAIGFFDANGKSLGCYNKLWALPPGVKMSAGAVSIHRITSSKLQREGVHGKPEIREVLHIFRRMRSRGKKVVAHNSAFDVRILTQTAKRHNVQCDFYVRDTFCTMSSSKHLCDIRSVKTGKVKNPSNSELYQFLTGKKPTGQLHDALTDVRVTAASYVAGSERGWW